MKPGGGSYKGSVAEVEVSKLVDQWYKVPPKTFWRTHSSGAWSEEPGDVKSRNTELTGQIPWMLESKHVKDIDLLMDVVNSKLKDSVFYSWWAEITDQHRKYYKVHGVQLIRLLTFKRNWSPRWVAFYKHEIQFPDELYRFLKQYITVPVPDGTVGVIEGRTTKNKKKTYVLLDPGTIIIVEWNVFVEMFSNPKEDFKESFRLLNASVS